MLKPRCLIRAKAAEALPNDAAIKQLRKDLETEQ